MQLGVYCETLTPQRLAEPDVLSLLSEFDVTLAHAIQFTHLGGDFRPEHAARHLEFAAKLKEAGGRYAWWPLLPKAFGYWPNERNLGAFERLIDTLLLACEKYGASPDLIVFDIETPWRQIEKIFFPGVPALDRALAVAKMLLGNRNPRRFAWAAGKLQEIVSRVQCAGIQTAAAAFAFLIADLVRNGHVLQDYLEMPIFPVKFDGYNGMFYTSYVPKAAPMIVPKAGASRFVYEYARVLSENFGDRAWITLGSTWEGVIPGNEGLAYDRPAQLIADAAAAKAAGIGHLWLYCLEGVLYKDQALLKPRTQEERRAFFDVLRSTPTAEPAPHSGWSRGRRRLEWAAGDWLRWSYDW
ncbi:MAG: hypothetical protein P9L99_06190 [Candidatus Lernaella stagnicola]|nr:hypothetical protein [Candidatus Lernaella stagnicola]